MKLITKCAWCGQIMGIKEVEDAEAPPLPITHSICRPCLEKLIKEAEDTIAVQNNNNPKTRR